MSEDSRTPTGLPKSSGELPVGSRYLWSPVVHRELHEACHFFIFSTTDSRGQRLHDALTAIHDRVGIRGSTAYVVQGPYDLIVRVWLTPIRRQAYLDALEREGDRLKLASVYEYSATAVDYAWLSKDEEELQKSLSTSDEFADASWIQRLSGRLDENLQPRPDSLRDLLETGFLIEVDDPSARRLFMFISTDGTSRYPGTRLHDSIRAAAAAVGLERVSVYYHGQGLCDFILKGFIPPSDAAQTSPKFAEDEKSNTIEVLQERLAQLGLVGWTLSPMRASYILGSESIDALREDSAQVLALLMQHLQEDYPDSDELLLALQRDDNAAFVQGLQHRVAEECLKVSSPPIMTRVQRRVLSIIAGLLVNSRKRVNRETSFLVSIPSDLRDVLQQRGITPETTSGLEPPNDDDLLDLATLLADNLANNTNYSDYVSAEFVHAIPRLAESSLEARRLFFSGKLLSDAYGGPFSDKVVDDQLRMIMQSAIFQIHVEDLLQHRELDELELNDSKDDQPL